MLCSAAPGAHVRANLDARRRRQVVARDKDHCCRFCRSNKFVGGGAGNKADTVFGRRAIGYVARCEDEGPRPAKLVDYRMELAVTTAFRMPDRLKICPLFRRWRSGGPSRGCYPMQLVPVGQKDRRQKRISFAKSPFRSNVRTDCRRSWAGHSPWGNLASGSRFEDMHDPAQDPSIVLASGSRFQDMHDPAQDPSIVIALGTRLVRRQMRDDLRPLLIAEPKQIRLPGLGRQLIDQTLEAKHD